MWFKFKNVTYIILLSTLHLLITFLGLSINVSLIFATSQDMTTCTETVNSTTSTMLTEDAFVSPATPLHSVAINDLSAYKNLDFKKDEIDSLNDDNSTKRFSKHFISITKQMAMPVSTTINITELKLSTTSASRVKQHILASSFTTAITANELLQTFYNNSNTNSSSSSRNFSNNKSNTNNNNKTYSDDLSSLSLLSINENSSMLFLISPSLAISNLYLLSTPSSSPSAPLLANVGLKLNKYPGNMNSNRNRSHLLVDNTGNNETIAHNGSNLYTIVPTKTSFKYNGNTTYNNSKPWDNNNNTIRTTTTTTVISTAWNSLSLSSNISENHLVTETAKEAIKKTMFLTPITTTKTINSVTRISARKVNSSNNKNKFSLPKSQKTDAPMLNYIFDTFSSANKHHHHDQRYGPHFEDVQRVGQPTNLTVQAGSSIYLNCRISLLQDKTVSWVRRNAQGEDALDLLTVGLHTYTGDKRYKIEFQYPNNWRLKIINVKKDDEATYECQISTHPPRVIQINLHVNAPKVMITDEFVDPLQEKYYEIDSTLQLSCVVRNVAMSSSVVFWKHGDNVLNYDVTRGGVSVKTELMDDGANSTLYIAKINKADSGNYTCSINEYQNYTIAVHILNGESFAELHHGKANKTNHPTVLIINVVLLIKLMLCACCLPAHIDR